MSFLLERLRKHQHDRGMMANLRCGLVESKKHRAWPVLHRLGVRVTDEVAALVASLYAVHPVETPKGNLGDTCKAIERSRGEKRGEDNKLTSTERRFMQLLDAERGDELFGRVIRMILMAESQGAPVNYEQLETDLRFWNDQTQTQWAASFWTPGVDVALAASVEEGGEQ